MDFDSVKNILGELADRTVDTVSILADKAASVTTEAVSRGKDKLDTIALENELAKAQRQLGALIYSLHKTGEENPELVQRYIDVVADVEARLNDKAVEEAERNCVPICPVCGAEVSEDAGFCSRCGAKLS